MKKRGILNSRLSALIAGLGHMDLLMIGDAGMPIPAGVEVVDLVLTEGVPAFDQVLRAVVSEIVTEHYYVAEETKEKSAQITELLAESMPGVSFTEMPHAQLKEFSKNVKFAIRTGEFTPYANVILQCGCAFS